MVGEGKLLGLLLGGVVGRGGKEEGCEIEREALSAAASWC